MLKAEQEQAQYEKMLEIVQQAKQVLLGKLYSYKRTRT